VTVYRSHHASGGDIRAVAVAALIRPYVLATPTSDQTPPRRLSNTWSSKAGLRNSANPRRWNAT
jgi:hypothetical protein